MFASPLGLLALLAIPAIVGLHLFRRRFRPQTVSALFLWLDADRTPLAGRKKERLRNSLSLWAEIAAALALALAFAGLRGCGDQPGVHLVAVLDASASMGAVAPVADGRSAADRAVAQLAERIEELPRGSRVTIVRSGARPALIAGPAAFPEEAAKSLAGFAPRAPRHDLTSSVAFALQVSGGGRVAVFTDRYEPDRFPPEVELVAVGVPAANVGIVRARRERARSRATGAVVERALVVLQNFSAEPATARVAVHAADVPGPPGTALVEPREHALQPRERKSLSYELPPGATGVGPVRIALADDALAIDNEAWLVAPPARTLALATTFDAEEARRLGLASGDPGPGGEVARLDRLLAIVDESTEAASPDAAHVVLGRGIAGGSASWCLAVDAPGTERKDFVGPFLFEKRHPLLEGLTLEGIVWSADPEQALTGIPLVAAGNFPLCVEDELDGRRIFRLDLDPARSSLARSPDWPILLSNLCELRRRALPGPERTNLLVGDDLTYRAGAAVAAERGDLVFAAEDGSVPPRAWPPRPEILIDELERPGLYRLTQGDTTLCRVAVSFADELESDLAAAKSGHRPAEAGVATLEASASWVEALLLALAVGAVVIDWIALARARKYVATADAGGKEPRGLPAP